MTQLLTETKHSTARCHVMTTPGRQKKSRPMVLPLVQRAPVFYVYIVTRFVFLPDVCAEDKDGGPCYADMLRYHFDVSIGRCRPFTYGGCQGNGNNFRTQEECYSVCTRQPSKYNDYVYKPGRWT